MSGSMCSSKADEELLGEAMVKTALFLLVHG